MTETRVVGRQALEPVDDLADRAVTSPGRTSPEDGATATPGRLILFAAADDLVCVDDTCLPAERTA